jgi:hypothetical protein
MLIYSHQQKYAVDESVPVPPRDAAQSVATNFAASGQQLCDARGRSLYI